MNFMPSIFGGTGKSDGKLAKPPSTSLLIRKDGQPTAISLPRQIPGKQRMSSTFTKRYPLTGNIAPLYPNSDPAAVIFDQTGSNKHYAAVFIRELHNLMSYTEGLYKYSRLPEVAFGATGDARNNERFPIQLCGFTSNIVGAKMSLESLYLEGNGGGNDGESYDLAFYGLASRIDLAPGQKGFVVFLADEPYFMDIRPGEVRTYFGETAKFATIHQSLSAIREKGLDVYTLLRDSSVTSLWTELLGKGYVATLDSPEKVVQAIVGIMAGRAGRKKEFAACLAGGSNKSIAAEVTHALNELDIAPKGLLGQ